MPLRWSKRLTVFGFSSLNLPVTASFTLQGQPSRQPKVSDCPTCIRISWHYRNRGSYTFKETCNNSKNISVFNYASIVSDCDISCLHEHQTAFRGGNKGGNSVAVARRQFRQFELISLSILVHSDGKKSNWQPYNKMFKVDGIHLLGL